MLTKHGTFKFNMKLIPKLNMQEQNKVIDCNTYKPTRSFLCFHFGC